MKKVQVLISTYNGSKYLRQQLDSIINQEDVEVSILVRDDGSTDLTEEILKEYAKKGLLEYYNGNNIGYAKSFFELLSTSKEADYYAFADQDDVWDKDKLATGIRQLIEYDNTIPLLYCSNLRVVNENLEFISKLHPDSEKISIDKKCSLVENLSYGCTSIFNNKAREMALMHRPKYTSHDGWINLICCFFGKVVYDDEPHINYRQHGKNVLGGKRDFISVWRKRLKSFKKLNVHIRDISAKEFLDSYNELLTQEDKQCIEMVANYRKSLKNKMKLFLNKDIKMCNLDRDFWYRIRVLCGNI